tara:strand:- start:650 stop:937 length:288 start_codon:yes stop_codon:yes gene_type:complete
MATKKKTVKKKTVKKKGATKGCGIKNGCKSKKGGLTAKGRRMINKKTGSNLKAPQPGGGPRKKSFCARFKGMKGPMKKPNGKPTRKALAMRRWKC